TETSTLSLHDALPILPVYGSVSVFGVAPVAMDAPPWRSGLQRELLERVAAGGREPAAHRERPGHLAHVDVAPRVHGQTVRRREAPGRAGVGAAPPRQHPARVVVDAHPAAARRVDGPVALRRLA